MNTKQLCGTTNFVRANRFRSKVNRSRSFSENSIDTSLGKNWWCRNLWHIQNILQWSKNNFTSKKTTNGDYLSPKKLGQSERSFYPVLLLETYSVSRKQLDWKRKIVVLFEAFSVSKFLENNKIYFTFKVVDFKTLTCYFSPSRYK